MTNPAQHGQPCPLVLLFGEAVYWYPQVGHCHVTCLFDPLVSLVARVLSVNCAAMCGCVVARSVRPGCGRRCAQLGHAACPLTMLATVALKVVPHFSQRHFVRLFDCAVSFVACDWSASCLAMSGRVVAMSFSPGMIIFPVQIGHFVGSLAIDLLYMGAVHVWFGWLRQRHVTRLFEPGMYLWASSGSASIFAKSGRLVAMSLNPGSSLLLAQYGQPVFMFVREDTGAIHIWSGWFGHCH